jgi:hypothetical protein
MSINKSDLQYLHFRTKVKRKFVEGLIVYLDYKIREGERIKNERKQLSFW